ncbi:MAG: mechanosensitive ion channel family protein, partial [Candidatus Marinamargulisbacteria bacterium]
MIIATKLQGLISTNMFDTVILKAVLSVIAIFALWLAHQTIVFFAKRHISNHDTIYTTRKMSRYLQFIIGAFIIGQLWFKGFQSLGTFLGLFTAGVAIALKDVVTNFAGWLYLLWQAPFKIGDRIQIQDHQGDVIDIGVFKFTLLEIGNWVDANQSTGRMIRIPNADIFNQPIANYSKGFNYIWYEIPVVLTYESNWRKTKELLLEIINNYCHHYEDQLKRELRKAQKDYPINYTYITPTIYTTALDHGISLTVR